MGATKTNCTCPPRTEKGVAQSRVGRLTLLSELSGAVSRTPKLDRFTA